MCYYSLDNIFCTHIIYNYIYKNSIKGYILYIILLWEKKNVHPCKSRTQSATEQKDKVVMLKKKKNETN